MAGIAVLASGVLGFAAAIMAFISMQISLFAAFGIWWFCSCLIAVLALALLVSPRLEQAGNLSDERA
jgi:hypothetical protein